MDNENIVEEKIILRCPNCKQEWETYPADCQCGYGELYFDND